MGKDMFQQRVLTKGIVCLCDLFVVRRNFKGNCLHIIENEKFKYLRGYGEIRGKKTNAPK